MPNKYNFALMAYFQNLSATGYSTSSITILQKNHISYFKLYIENIRNKIQEYLASSMNYRNSQISSALIIGKKDGIDQFTIKSIRDSGLAHLLAISGLHMSIVAGIFFISIRSMLIFINNQFISIHGKKIAALITIFATFSYLLISGSPVSAQRAFIMLSVIFIAILFNKNSLNTRSIAISATIILLLQPESILKPGFQMSFSAVLSLISIHNFLKKKISKKSKKFYFIDIIISSLAASLATTPFTAYHFNSISVAGIISNLIAIPIMSFLVLPSGILLLLFYKIPLLSSFFSHLMSYGIDVIISTAEYTNTIPFHIINVLGPSGISLFFISLGFLWLTLWEKPWRILGLPIILVSILLSVFNTTNPTIIAHKKLVAIKGHDNRLYFLKNRIRRNFISNIWLQQYLQTDILKHKDHINTDKVSLNCNNTLCTYKIHGTTIAIIFENTSIQCSDIELLIHTNQNIKDMYCPKKTITYSDLNSNGTHSIYINEKNNIRITNVAQTIGIRPWTI